MSRTDYHDQLSWLTTEVVLLAELVVDRYDDALRAAATGDRRLAEQVVDGDSEINERYLELEAACIDLIALEQPVAGDLRRITASFKIITDLERIADLATNLAEHTRAGREGIHPAVDIASLGGDAREMVEDAIAAYESTDSDACRAVAARDDDLDAACDRTTQRIIRSLLADDAEAGDRESTRTAASHGLLTVRDIERVGDHAVNIAARTVYMVDGDDQLLY
ncbi:phosphate transport system protein [Halohasta litchfieldiae]|jgi:phosphate transport system protein|uniref:Phosphate-specific transport system accessory protein PhoU n=1 Tax=Halohasta litchfieldiae TaxID=1073996 RepID=A0A1H6RZM3_9EURY|nr:phosphate signaling complex protein PhoU [Halohasta litchfieldiae]ATW87974.1 phosphate transport system protein [Halohasta litchfieldiae]SEI61213.1 phosphate transport system protein [Halohasta litchfieldiae]